LLTFSFILFLTWVLAMVLAVWSAEVARMFARRIGKAASRSLTDYFPPVAVILPIKGVEEDTVENVQALLRQKYPRCRLLFAIESESDPVRSVLERLAAEEGSGRVEIVVAGLAQTRGQKVHNQLAAIARTSEADEILVFMDADARPNPTWLQALVGPLFHKEVGATTGFRFYLPAGPHLANGFLSVINAGVAALLGPQWRNFAWGGSMAIRRKDFFDLGVFDAWQNALSDDYVLSYCVKYKAKRKIEFVQKCLVASTANLNWHGFFEFACRQYRITRICALGVWFIAVGGALVYLIALCGTPIVWLNSLRPGSTPDHLQIVMFLALYLTSVFRGYCLYHGGKWGLPAQALTLRRVFLLYTWGYPTVVFVNLLALLGSSFGREIQWRGVSYTMHSLTKTEVHRPEPQPVPPTSELEPAGMGRK
jgi:ceramide glucosyltransferase